MATDLIKEAKIAVELAEQKEQWAVRAYADAYRESFKREEEGNIVLYATEDGWDDGPLPYALEFSNGSDVDSDDERWAVFLFRDGGPTCERFLIAQAAEAVWRMDDVPALGALHFVRQLTLSNGRVAFQDGHQVAGLLLAVLDKEGL